MLRTICYKTFGDKTSDLAPSGSPRFGTDEYGRDIEKGLEKYVLMLRKRGIDLNCLVLLGSRAKNRWNPKSDVDIVVIAGNLPEEKNHKIPFGEILNFRRWSLLSDRPLFIGVEPSGCCSKREFVRRVERFDLQALDALYYGEVLWDDGFWKKMKMRLERIEKIYKLDRNEIKQLIYSA